jgi:hypothetical protein
MSRRLSVLEQRIDWTRGFRCPTDQAVLKAMARWFAWRPDGENIRFTVGELARKAGVAKRSTERALERLEADWWIEVTARTRGSRRPTVYRIVLARLATGDPDGLTLATTARVADETSDQPPQWRMKWRMTGSEQAENRPDSEKVADQSTEAAVRTGTPASDLDRTKVNRHSGGRPEHSDVPAFLDWAAATYPIHAQGAHLVIDRDRDGHLVHGLLEHYPLERLQAMAVQCWTIQADGDPTSHATWIAKSDRSLRVLRHKAPFLERLVVGAMQLTFGALESVPLTRRELEEARLIRNRSYGGCPHNPRCESGETCVEAIAWARRSAAS